MKARRIRAETSVLYRNRVRRGNISKCYLANSKNVSNNNKAKSRANAHLELVENTLNNLAAKRELRENRTQIAKHEMEPERGKR